MSKQGPVAICLRKIATKLTLRYFGCYFVQNSNQHAIRHPLAHQISCVCNKIFIEANLGNNFTMAGRSIAKVLKLVSFVFKFL